MVYVQWYHRHTHLSISGLASLFSNGSSKDVVLGLGLPKLLDVLLFINDLSAMITFADAVMYGWFHKKIATLPFAFTIIARNHFSTILIGISLQLIHTDASQSPPRFNGGRRPTHPYTRSMSDNDGRGGKLNSLSKKEPGIVFMCYLFILIE